MPLDERSKSKVISKPIPLNPRKRATKKVSHCSTAQYFYDRYAGDDPERIAEYEEIVLNSEIARKIHDMRTKAGLSQRELAKRVGTSASAICRLEDAGYEGHSLSLLKRIADALGRRVEVRFPPAKRSA